MRGSLRALGPDGQPRGARDDLLRVMLFAGRLAAGRAQAKGQHQDNGYSIHVVLPLSIMYEVQEFLLQQKTTWAATGARSGRVK